MSAHGPGQIDAAPNSKRLKSQSGFERQFEFVDGLSSRKAAGRAKTRSFVTKEYYRQKRFQRAQREGDAGPRQHEQTPGTDDSGVVVAREKTQAVRSRRGESEVSLLERLGGGRSDPFNSYPIPATRDVHVLVDHCELQL